MVTMNRVQAEVAAKGMIVFVGINHTMTAAESDCP